MALTLGPLVVEPAVVLAPMAGVTNVAFRRLCREFGGGLFVSEMISARALAERNARTEQMLAFAPGEPRSVQLHGADPAYVGAAVTRLVAEWGVEHVDLNMGCPVPKVTRTGGGAAIPARPALFGAIVAAAVRAGGGVPVTVKLRDGVDARTPTYLAAARIAADAGVAAVSLHARTAEQFYAGRADWSAIARLKEALPDTPVVGNGDVWSAADAVRMRAGTGCDAVMVGRGCLGQPWLFRDLAGAFAGRPVTGPPPLGEVAAVMRRHLGLLVEAKGATFGVLEFRRHLGWYLTGYPVAAADRRALVGAPTVAAVTAVLDGLDPDVPLAEPERRIGRNHTAGPRRVPLPERWHELAEDPTPPRGADVLVSGG